MRGHCALQSAYCANCNKKPQQQGCQRRKSTLPHEGRNRLGTVMTPKAGSVREAGSYR